MKPEDDITDPRVVKALAHPLRVKLLAALDEKESSPSELSKRLNAPLGNVSYHIRILASLGLIELSATTPKRGSVEHSYRSARRPVISDAAWAAVPESVKDALVGAALEKAGEDVLSALRSGGFSRAEAHLSRTPIELDQQGWAEMADLLREFLDQIERVSADAKARLEGKGSGESATILMMLFANERSDEDS